MISISIPLSLAQHEQLETLVHEGAGKDYIQVIHRAIDLLAEEEAVRAVLEAEKEIPIRGDIRKILLED